MPIAGPPVTVPTPVRPASERINVTWHAPDGTVLPLTDPGAPVRLQATSSLTKGVPTATTTDPNPRGGSLLRHIQPLERFVILPVLVRGRTHQEFIDRWRSVGWAFMQTKRRGPGTLRVQRPDGSAREIDLVYHDGWEGRPEHGWDWDVADALTLLAPRPWWRSTEPVEISASFQVEGIDFYDPFMTIALGAVLGRRTLTNDGEAPAWPEWTITGPLDQFVATNHSTGESFTIDPNWDGGGSLGVGETVTISSDPIRVRGPAGEVWTGAITGTLWPLDPGPSDVEFVATGADEGSSVRLRFHELYETA